MTSIHSVVSYDSCRWAVCVGWTGWIEELFGLANLIVLYILFLRASFTSHNRWESQTFHHNENSSGSYSGGFSKSFGLELTTSPGFLKQNYTTLNYTLYYTTLCLYMTSRKWKGTSHWKCGNALKFSEGGIVGKL